MSTPNILGYFILTNSWGMLDRVVTISKSVRVGAPLSCIHGLEGRHGDLLVELAP
jgi:hypothetical protein